MGEGVARSEVSLHPLRPSVPTSRTLQGVSTAALMSGREFSPRSQTVTSTLGVTPRSQVTFPRLLGCLFTPAHTAVMAAGQATEVIPPMSVYEGERLLVVFLQTRFAQSLSPSPPILLPSPPLYPHSFVCA